MFIYKPNIMCSTIFRYPKEKKVVGEDALIAPLSQLHHPLLSQKLMEGEPAKNPNMRLDKAVFNAWQ